MNTRFDSPVRLPALLRLLQRVEFPRKLGLCQALFGRELARHGVCWARTAAGPVWKLDLTNPTHRWMVFGYYEGPALWRWVRSRALPIGTIVDSGANIGQTVLTFASLLPAARIFAYEPGAGARHWLNEGVATNAFSQVTVLPAGLGAQSGSARLRQDGATDRHGAWNKVNPHDGEVIPLVALDDELDRLALPTLDLWKLDMEGYELFALQGAKRALERGRIRSIYIETAGEPGRECLDYLTSRGYRVHGIAPSGRLVAWRPLHSYDNALCLAPGTAGAAA